MRSSGFHFRSPEFDSVFQFRLHSSHCTLYTVQCVFKAVHGTRSEATLPRFVSTEKLHLESTNLHFTVYSSENFTNVTPVCGVHSILRWRMISWMCRLILVSHCQWQSILALRGSFFFVATPQFTLLLSSHRRALGSTKNINGIPCCMNDIVCPWMNILQISIDCEI